MKNGTHSILDNLHQLQLGYPRFSPNRYLTVLRFEPLSEQRRGNKVSEKNVFPWHWPNSGSTHYQSGSMETEYYTKILGLKSEEAVQKRI